MRLMKSGKDLSLSGPPNQNSGKVRASGSGGGHRREVYVEFYPVGNSTKVVAVDSVTGLEVSIVGPSNAPQRTLQQNAIRKLEYMLAKIDQK